MSTAVTGPLVGRLRRRWLSVGSAPWWPVWSKAAALRAARTTLVMPGLFAFTDKVIGNLQMALFAGFGSFATLVLVTFTGDRTDKLRAHLGLALAGSALLSVGTAVSGSTALAALVTLLLTFIVFFSGAAGPNAASGVTGALLIYVLPAASPGTIGMIPDRLAGWWMASVAGTAAVLLLPAPPTADRLRASVARVATGLADALEAMLAGAATDATLQACVDAKYDLLATYSATPLRPIGTALRDQALARAVELVQWCTSLVIDSGRARPDLSEIEDVQRELVGASAAALRTSGGLMGGGAHAPDLARLDDARRQSLAWINALSPASPDYDEAARLSLHAHTIATTALAIGADALAAAGVADAAGIEEVRARRLADAASLGEVRPASTLARYVGVATRHATLRSVWLINSLRGALALAAAVAVADLSNVQHGFWVVLGTLSVLRTNASATGATALRALLGTTVGFMIGGALLLAIGTTSTALWAVLPVAVLVAAYAPGVAPFAAGQAAFTVTVAILFNLLVPVGWKVGELRVEDVAIGCAVSVIVGILFWPRGVGPLVGDDLADAFLTGAAYLKDAVRWATGGTDERPPGGSAAIAAGLRLDDALRGFLAEQGTKHISSEELWRLIGGTLRLRLTAHGIAHLPHGCARERSAARAGATARVDRLEAWYGHLASYLGPPAERALAQLAPPPPAAAKPVPARSRHIIWLDEYLDELTDHLGDLVTPAVQLAEIRRRPWWR